MRLMTLDGPIRVRPPVGFPGFLEIEIGGAGIDVLYTPNPEEPDRFCGVTLDMYDNNVKALVFDLDKEEPGLSVSLLEDGVKAQ